ncbi:tetratricopeptide repeat protein (plasmid) [Borreliella finlandensis]|uniref:tetratricopeptide repeat protein n=1 Tax=Borreliella finlandensis TaxID=498741 RepID=UPI003AF0B845
MKIYLCYFFFLILNFNFLYSNSFEALNMEYNNILENYYSGKIDNRLVLKDQSEYINYYVDKFKILDKKLESFKDIRRKYITAIINLQIASLSQSLNVKNFSDSYSIFLRAKSDLLDFISSQFFKDCQKLVRSDAYRVLGDLNLSILRYTRGMKLVKVSNEAKNSLIKSLEIDNENIFANISLARWYLYSPRIAGGSSKKAIEFLQKALKYSKRNLEKYLTNIWLSQGYFRLKREDEYKRYLNEAKNIFPGGFFHKIVIQRNNLGELP